MAAGDLSKSQEMTYENLLQFVREHEHPCVTAGEVAEEFGITNEGANYRLKQLKKEDKLQDKRVGAAAKVWYLVG